MKGRAKHLYTILTEQFPKAFPADARQCRPLKIGIGDDLARELPEEDHRYIGTILGHHTHRPSYLKAMLNHQERIDLQSNLAGEVTDTAREIATRQYAEAMEVMKAKTKEKQAREKAQQQQPTEARQQQDKGKPKPKLESPSQAPPGTPVAAPTPPPSKPGRRPTLSLKGKK